ncbi:HNH endonuclease family protein [Hydrocoleum sp. CS-953]|uniref:HNH endonuclease family protein n=1 Tax=Hydrocoleum sp. CS-953 TaxID=1671698 RepID=UPI00352B2114
MVFFQKEKDVEQRIKLLKILEKIGFLKLLSYTRHEYAFLFVYGEAPMNMIKLARELSKGEKKPKQIIESLEVFRTRLINQNNIVSRIKGDFQKSGFYKWHGIKYFLYEYELFLKEKSKAKRYKLNWDNFNNEDSGDFKTIEHIYPQNTHKPCWTRKFSNYNTPQRNILRQSLGNLLPLSHPKNSSLGNKCFEEKCSNGENVGYKYGSYSEIEVSEKDDWTAKEILERGLKLLNFMEERWGIKLGNRNEKIDFLNLGFVEEKEKEKI